MDAVITGAVAGVVLLGLWLAETRRHVDRKRLRNADWEQASGRPGLWTSGARCPFCRSGGGLLEVEADELWFECLACGRRHRRDTRG